MTRIAILSYNHNKYSETFIANMVKRLPGHIHYLYGGALPGFWGNNQPFTTTDKTQHLEQVEQYLLDNSIEAVIANYAVTAFPIMEICLKHNIPLIVHFHGWTAYRQSLINANKENYKRLFEIAAAIAAVSNDMMQQLEKMGAQKNKLRLITYGPDPDIFKYKDCSANPNTFFAAGRFCDTKNPHLTILAFHKVLQQLPNAKLVMAGGDENLLNACINLSIALQIKDKVDFAGVLPPQQIYERMCNAVAFVQHSATTVEGEKEGTPLAVLEASASGLPVVATRHAGIKDVVLDGKTGLLCDEFDINTMANNMLLVANNRNLAQKMGLAASKRIDTNFSMKQYIEKLGNLVEGVIGSRK